MLFFTIVKVALKSLLGNKLRSFLTMLGIIIGVGAVIAMLAISNGAKDAITSNIKSLGSNILFIRPGASRHMGVSVGSKETLKEPDLYKLLNIDHVKMVSPEVNSSSQIKYFNKNMNCRIYGVAPTYFEMRNYEIDEGQKFNDNDVLSFQKVAVIGPDVVKELFPSKYPINKTIKIKGMNFKVIGVTKSKGDSGFFSSDEMIFIPYSVSMKKLTGKDYFSSINISIDNDKNVEPAKEKIKNVLRNSHKLRKEQADDFYIRDMKEILDKINKTVFIFKLLLAGVAALSLLVGGIGIMNIMFVTVTERTKEIGVRKALGAKNKDILNQFLIEAIVLTVIGGILGILFGTGSIALYNVLSPKTYFKGAVDILSIIISVTFSISIGIFFGFYPAFKAAKLNPIEALRYE